MAQRTRSRNRATSSRRIRSATSSRPWPTTVRPPDARPAHAGLRLSGLHASTRAEDASFCRLPRRTNARSSEREATLVEFSSGAAARDRANAPTFVGFWRRFWRFEHRAARGRALTSIVNAQLGAEQARLETELAQLKARTEARASTLGARSPAPLRPDREARRGERERCQISEAVPRRARATARRDAHAGRRRKLASASARPTAGQIPEPEAAQLASLRAARRSAQPGVAASARRARASRTGARLRLHDAARELGAKRAANRPQKAGLGRSAYQTGAFGRAVRA